MLGPEVYKHSVPTGLGCMGKNLTQEEKYETRLPPIDDPSKTDISPPTTLGRKIL